MAHPESQYVKSTAMIKESPQGFLFRRAQLTIDEADLLTGINNYQPIFPLLLSLISSFWVSEGSSGITKPGGGSKASYFQ